MNKTHHLLFQPLFTHFPTPDQPRNSINQQYTFFKHILNQLHKPIYIHSQNSPPSLLIHAQFSNPITLPISLYPYYPSQYLKHNLKVHLTPTPHLLSQTLQLKTLKPPQTLSYPPTYIPHQQITIPILPIPYPHPYLTSIQPPFLNLNPTQSQLIPPISIDQFILNLPSHLKTPQKLILIHNHLHSPQSPQPLPNKQPTINYQLLSNLS
ncbi:alanine racemase C-terminal domain-containing protein, partial [Staphylococcus epidermidis]|uniref:alanine racemase C-terminal domain-containing protein n=1 Tax=Staphylococcus epidermidis TaxID=1282 RepID=UPI0037DA2E79